MGNIDLLSGLSLFTIAAVVVLAVAAYLRFMRKPANRHPMDNAKGAALDELRASEHGQTLRDTPPTRAQPTSRDRPASKTGQRRLNLTRLAWKGPAPKCAVADGQSQEQMLERAEQPERE